MDTEFCGHIETILEILGGKTAQHKVDLYLGKLLKFANKSLQDKDFGY